MGLLLVWTALMAFALVKNKSDQSINAYIPKNANLIFKLNSKDFFKSSTYSLIFSSKDQQLLNSFEAFLNKQRKGTGKSTDFGIDFVSDFTFYAQDFNQGQNYVILFNLMNRKKFLKNMPASLSKNQAMAIKGNMGALVTYYGEQPAKQAKIKAFAQGIFKKTSGFKFSFAKEELFNTNFTNYRVNSQLFIDKGKISSSISETQFKIQGELDVEFEEGLTRRWSLIPALSDNPLHIENSIFSKMMQDTIQRYMEKMGISSPPINHVSFNYYGIKLQFTDKTDIGVIFTPIFDLIVTFDSKYDVDEIFKNSAQIEKFGFIRVNNAIVAEDVKYKIREIDSTTLYIGNNNELVIKRNKNDLFRISGDISRLTHVEGGGFFLNTMLNAYPPYKASKDLFEGIQRVKLVVKPKGKKVTIDGKIDFHPDHYLFNDLFKFYLNIKGEY